MIFKNQTKMANSKKKLSFTTPPIPPAWKLDKPYNHNVWLIFFVKVPWITSSPLPVLQTFLRLCKKIIVSSFLESPWQFSWLYVIVTLSTYLIESDNFVNSVSFLFVHELTIIQIRSWVVAQRKNLNNLVTSKWLWSQCKHPVLH